MNDDGRLVTPANILTAFRVIAAPVMVYLAIAGHATHFIWLVVASFLSDAADGAVARFLGGATQFGSKLDSVADAASYSAIGVSVVLLFPEVVREELLTFGVLLASLLVPAAAGLVKYGQLTSYHTWLVKAAAVVTALGLLLLLCDIATWPFRLGVMLGAVSALEQLAITLVLRQPVSDVSSIFTARRLQRSV
jgi:CDP-diacylglycerol--glycerol-3-phosphate 3-phosphatidyltransferase